MPFLAQTLELTTGRPVLDETGITGKYDFTLSYNGRDPNSAIEAVRGLGFKIESAGRPVEFLVVPRDE